MKNQRVLKRPRQFKYETHEDSPDVRNAVGAIYSAMKRRGVVSVRQFKFFLRLASHTQHVHLTAMLNKSHEVHPLYLHLEPQAAKQLSHRERRRSSVGGFWRKQYGFT